MTDFLIGLDEIMIFLEKRAGSPLPNQAPSSLAFNAPAMGTPLSLREVFVVEDSLSFALSVLMVSAIFKTSADRMLSSRYPVAG